jgi:alkanesulfonate monooxygenase SsuD/methylene tetrahydromethanopterin reductase-like flavin-dependent oxidoreductase (luciferase family)
MRVVAKRADWWNLGFRRVEEYARKLAVLKEHCAGVGRDPSTLTLTYYAQLSVSKDPSRVKQHDRLYAVVGTPDRVAAELQQCIDLGVRHIMVRPSDFPSLEGIETFQSEVIPRLRIDWRATARAGASGD